MADITKCVKGCEKKETCYRWTAKAITYQGMSDFKPVDGKCEYYWETKGKTND